MIPTEVSIRGVLKADGTLELAERPDLPEGPVGVVIKAVPKAEPAPGGEGWWEYLQRARAELEAEGGHFRTGEEIDAEIAEMRDWGEDRIEAARQRDDPC